MVRNRSCPAVSQIWSLIVLPSNSMVRIFCVFFVLRYYIYIYINWVVERDDLMDENMEQTIEEKGKTN
jgi:hypothetical protein